MNLFAEESQNRDYLFTALEEALKKYDLNMDLLIGKEIPVPYEHIYMPHRKELEIWCFKQDICIYEIIFDKTVGYKDAAIASGGAEILKIRLEKSNAQNTKDVGMPLLSVETKMAKGITTHELLAYSEKVKKIKSIFPYCMFFLLVFGAPSANTYKHGSCFDEILYMENLDNKTCNGVIEQLMSGLKTAQGKVICIASE
jgi:hypothetical protein